MGNCKSRIDEIIANYKGKGKGKAADDGGGDKDAAAEPPVDLEAPAAPTVAPSAEPPPEAKKAEIQPKKVVKITKAVVLQLLREAKASPEQTDFFNAWSSSIMDEVPETAKKVLMVSTNMQFLEVRIQYDAKRMVELAHNFLHKCGVPHEQNFRFTKISQDNPELKWHSQVKHLLDVQSELDAVVATLWCRLKRMGTESPAIDAGFVSHPTEEKIEWLIADLLMPPTGDQEALRRYAEEEHFKPSAYWSSILPREPEQALSFDISMADAPKTELLRAFFFFKCLGFEKPEDAVVRYLNNCGPKKCNVIVSMGPQGLTRVSLRVWHTSLEARKLADDLSKCLKFDPCKAGDIQNIIGGDPNSIVYSAESSGYTVACVFES
jgi:hypothetical protein